MHIIEPRDRKWETGPCEDGVKVLNMNQEKISVIVPVYNAEKYLNRCVESILKQTWSNLGKR